MQAQGKKYVNEIWIGNLILVFNAQRRMQTKHYVGNMFCNEDEQASISSEMKSLENKKISYNSLPKQTKWT